MKDVLASLYSLHPCLIAATQALAAKRMLSGSISFHRYAVRCHIYTTMYGGKFVFVGLEPSVLIDVVMFAKLVVVGIGPLLLPS
jgi:hypothetical protein